MRTLLVTGPGGAGRTGVAAAAALSAARSGLRTLLISEGPASPGDGLVAVFGETGGEHPVSVAPLLDLVRPLAESASREGLLLLQERAPALFDLLGAERMPEAEPGVLPGAGELALLGALRRYGGLGAGGTTGGAGGAGGTGGMGEAGASAAARGPEPGLADGGPEDRSRPVADVTGNGAAGAPGEGDAPGRQAARDDDGIDRGKDINEGKDGNDGAAPSREPYELVVVDLPPLAEAVRLLALPGVLRRLLARTLPAQRPAARALRPVLGRLAGVPLPTEAVYEAAARWDRELAAAEALSASAATQVLLVAEPSAYATGAVGSALNALALHRLGPAALVANRVVPEGATGAWAKSLAAAQREVLDGWQELRVPGPVGGTGPVALPVCELPHLGREIGGPEDLEALAEPLAAFLGTELPGAPASWPVADRLAEDGLLLWRIPLPAARREDIDLVRRGDELVLRTGPWGRVVPLPSALRRCSVAGAALREGVLELRFTPDPGLWPEG